MATASRAIRKVTIKLGPIMLEAGIHGAIEDDDAGIVRVCTHAGSQQERTAPSRIKRRDYCPVCDQDEVSTFRRAKVVGGGVVLLDPNALQALVEADAATKTSIELTVHPTEQMTRAFPTGKSYYLVPRAGAAGNYALLATLMAKRPDRSFVGEFAFQGAPALYQVQVSDGIIAMRQLARPEAVRDAPLVDQADANPAYLELAEQFADAICTDYDPAAYRDKRAEGVAKLVEAALPIALAGGDEPTPTGTVDLAAALQAALAKAAPATEKKPAPRRAPRKKPDAA